MILIFITLFSLTPNLSVLEMHTWFQLPQYENDLYLKFLLSSDSEFYEIYQFRTDLGFVAQKLGHIIAYAAWLYCYL